MSVVKEFKYDIRDEVYIAQETQGFVGAIKCGTCNGTGVLYNSSGAEVTCPTCNGKKRINSRYVRLLKPSDEKLMITTLMVKMDNSIGTLTNRCYYKCGNTNAFYPTSDDITVSEDMVFATEEECIEYCNNYNKELEEKYG